MRFNALVVCSLVLLIVALPAFAQLPGPPEPRREVFAGDPYAERFPVSCVTALAGARPIAAVSVTIDPPNFTATVSPTQVSPGDIITVSAMVPVTTPAQDYKVTIVGVRISGDCASGGNTYTLVVKRPLRLDILNSAIQTVSPGEEARFDLKIRGRFRFAGPVRLRTDGLKNGFLDTFSPQVVTGDESTLRVRTPENPTECFEPVGCEFDIRAMADVQVDPTGGRIILRRQVELRARTPMVTVDPGDTTSTLIDIIRRGYPGGIL